MTKFSTFRAFAPATRKQAKLALLLAFALACPAFAGDVADQYRNAASALQSGSQNSEQLANALTQAARGNPAALRAAQALTIQRILNRNQSNTYDQAARQLTATEAPVNLPSQAAQATLAPAYMAPQVSLPNARATQAPRLDPLQIANPSASEVSGLTFARPVQTPGIIVPMNEGKIVGANNAAPADTGDDLNRAIADEPTPAPVRRSIVPQFDARELNELTTEMGMARAMEGLPMSNGMQLRPETSARRNAANRLMGTLAAPAQNQVSQVATDYRPTWYQRAVVPEQLRAYMRTQVIARGSFSSAHVSDGAANRIPSQTFRRSSSLLVGMPHDDRLRGLVAASQRPPDNWSSKLDGDVTHSPPPISPGAGGQRGGISAFSPSGNFFK